MSQQCDEQGHDFPPPGVRRRVCRRCGAKPTGVDAATERLLATITRRPGLHSLPHRRSRP